MHIEYLIVAIIVFIIVICQIYSYSKNKARIKRLQMFFPEAGNLGVDINDSVRHITYSDDDFTNDFTSTIDDINLYLEKNKNKTTEYHILKEIVNRKAQDVEEQVETMLSSPLYLGLMATIAGAAIGIISFAWSDLEGLLNGTQLQVGGIKTLLTDIGIAMSASFLGVLFTKQSTSDFKDARSVMLCNMNKFLSWIQTELMPNLSDDLTGALVKMTQDLNEFNNTFASNTQELKETLALVTESYQGQVEILDAIEKIKITKVARANIEVYEKLQGCTNEIEKLFDHLGQSNHYIQSVVALNNQLGNINERTKAFEEVGQYFKDEIEYVKDRQGLMRQQMSSLDSVLQEAMTNLGEGINHGITEFISAFQRQNQSVQLLIEEQENSLLDYLSHQQTAINQKIVEMSDPFSSLRDTFADIGLQTKQGIDSISASFEQQNEAIAQMLTFQREAMEKELSSYRQIMEQKLNDIPSQFQSISQMAQAVKSLGSIIVSQKSEMEEHGKIMSSLIAQLEKSQSLKNQTNPYIKYLTIGVFGSFVLLLIMLITQIFGINLHLYEY